jgi:hypothetical protein
MDMSKRTVKLYDHAFAYIETIRAFHQILDERCLPKEESKPLDNDLIVHIALDFYANWIRKREESE